MKECELCGRKSNEGNIHIHWCPRLNPVLSDKIDASVEAAKLEGARKVWTLLAQDHELLMKALQLAINDTKENHPEAFEVTK